MEVYNMRRNGQLNIARCLSQIFGGLEISKSLVYGDGGGTSEGGRNRECSCICKRLQMGLILNTNLITWRASSLPELGANPFCESASRTGKSCVWSTHEIKFYTKPPDFGDNVILYQSQILSDYTTTWSVVWRFCSDFVRWPTEMSDWISVMSQTSI